MTVLNLSFVSLMAANADALYQQIAAYLAARCGIAVDVVADRPWQQRAELLARGHADLGAICGAPYTRLTGTAVPPVELLVAPLMRAARYLGQPVYYSDVIVRADSAFQRFADLRGATWAYNEPESFSGYFTVAAFLAAHGETWAYFAAARQSGAHLESLRMVLGGAADATAIDSIVLERELQLRPGLAAEIRRIHAFGPSPIPPLVIGRHVPATIVRQLRRLLRDMHTDTHGQRLLHDHQLAGFTPVGDHDYDSIRAQLALAERLAPITDLHSNAESIEYEDDQ